MNDFIWRAFSRTRVTNLKQNPRISTALILYYPYHPKRVILVDWFDFEFGVLVNSQNCNDLEMLQENAYFIQLEKKDNGDFVKEIKSSDPKADFIKFLTSNGIVVGKFNSKLYSSKELKQGVFIAEIPPLTPVLFNKVDTVDE